MHSSSSHRGRLLPKLHFPVRLLAVLMLAFSGTAAVSRATSVVPPEFPTLVNDSDYIIRAVTRSVVAEKRVTGQRTKIVTKVELDVLEVVAGTAPARVTLEFLGGRVGDEYLKVEGMPQFKVGDEDVLFVSGNGRSICPLYAMMHGRYPVHTDSVTGQKTIARADGVPLQSVAEIAAPLAHGGAATLAHSGLSPAAFIQQIKASVRPDARFNRAQN
jgi:hypothetical protein